MTSKVQKEMLFNTKLLWILASEDRNAVWLSKKLSCSHTLCYNWLKGTTITEEYRFKIRALFGDKYEI